MRHLRSLPFRVVVMLRESSQWNAERSFFVGIARAYIPPVIVFFAVTSVTSLEKWGNLG